MDRVDEILLYIQKTNPEMTREKLVEKLRKSEYAAKSLIFGAKYDLVSVFSARMYLDNLTLPEYNSVKQSPMCLFLSIMYNHIQDFIAAH